MILAAEARKEAAIQEAEGKAKAIVDVNRATAEGLAMIKQTIGVEDPEAEKL